MKKSFVTKNRIFYIVLYSRQPNSPLEFMMNVFDWKHILNWFAL